MVNELIRQTIEYQQWGLNALTVSSIATIFFTTVLGWAFWRQDATVRKHRSGKSVSATWHTYYAFYSVSALIYGLHTHSIALLYNGLLCIPRFSVIAGLLKYKGFRKNEKLSLALFALMPVVLYLGPWRDIVFLIVSFGSVVAFAFQPLELWRQKSAGDVHIKLLITYCVANAFWVFYAYIARIWALMIITPTMFFLSCLAVILWFRYQPNKGTAAENEKAPQDSQNPAAPDVQ